MLMKKILLLIFFMGICIVSMTAQIRFSANANVYTNKNNQKVGTQSISANINADGVGTMILGTLKMKAKITNTVRDNAYKMTAYNVSLYSQNGKSVDAVITKRDKGTYSVLVYYADGALRYDFY